MVLVRRPCSTSSVLRAVPAWVLVVDEFDVLSRSPLVNEGRELRGMLGGQHEGAPAEPNPPVAAEQGAAA